MIPKVRWALCWVAAVWVSVGASHAASAALALVYDDADPRRHELSARASELDPRARPHPEIGFVFEKEGKPADVENAVVDTRVAPRGELVIWLMGHNRALFERLAGYGLHAIQVHYANGWFGKFGNSAPANDDRFLGRIRLEAATGGDFSEVVEIPGPDGIQERALRFVRWLARTNPQGRWDHFLTEDGSALRWDRVILAGSSHGSTTAARLAKHQKVARVVMFCGPRDQHETWQGLPSATPANRFFGFSHVLDTGWTGDHYCRSWELLGLREYGPIVNVDQASPPYGSSRRLITDVDVGNDPRRAHGLVTPGGSAVKDASGGYVHEAVWRHLFTHPVEETGDPVARDPECRLDLRAATSADSAPPTPKSSMQLFLLVGQSNMAGRGRIEEVDLKPHPRVLTLNAEGAWVPAVDPIHFDKPIAGVGLGKTFGEVIADANPRVTVGLIPCAVGGSPIDAWRPGEFYEPTKSHPWDDALRRARIALKSGELKGILWHQGESDATPELAEAYEAKLHDLARRFRDELAAPRAPFIAGQMGRFPDNPWDAAHERVDKAHRDLPEHVKFTAFVPSTGLDHNGDRIHFNAAAYRELGRRFAGAYQSLRK